MAHALTADILGNSNKYQSVAPKSVLDAVKQASAKTGVDFSYLMEKAATESAFDPNAEAKTSSATGLFQFIDNTWLSMIKQHGAKYGFDKYADSIEQKNGKATVLDPALRREILELRKDPKASAFMAAEFTKSNQTYIEGKLGRKANATDLYMAHFLGAGGATKFLATLQNSPDKDAKDIIPQAAKANKPVFYDRTDGGKARSVKEIYAMFSKKFGVDASSTIKSVPAPEVTIVAENTISARPAYGRISAPVVSNTVSSGNTLSAATIFATADMMSVLYDLSTERTYSDKEDNDKNLADYPTPGFFA